MHQELLFVLWEISGCISEILRLEKTAAAGFPLDRLEKQ